LLALTVVGAASASGGSTVVKGYGGTYGGPVGTVVTSHPSNHATTLPFTGFDLVGVALIALLVLGLGVVLMRSARKHDVAS
jgi:hypothetical protein